MADVYSKETRSYIMSQVRSKDTKPEEIVRKFLFSKGLRYRKNDKRYPGHPDIVLPKYNTIVFVNGCFWHSHDNCKYATVPSSNVEFWEEKLKGNKERDRIVQKRLEDSGWKVVVVWECELKKKNREQALENLLHQIIPSQ